MDPWRDKAGPSLFPDSLEEDEEVILAGEDGSILGNYSSQDEACRSVRPKGSALVALDGRILEEQDSD